VILVTGGSGNVGAEVTRAVLAAGYQVRGLSGSASAAGIPAGAEIARGDLNDCSSLRLALAGVDAVFLLAGYPDVPIAVIDPYDIGAGAALAPDVRRTQPAELPPDRSRAPASHPGDPRRRWSPTGRRVPGRWPFAR
jgi:uncharacterized protein YbjT (DUF2867 family)